MEEGFHARIQQSTRSPTWCFRSKPLERTNSYPLSYGRRHSILSLLQSLWWPKMQELNSSIYCSSLTIAAPLKQVSNFWHFLDHSFASPMTILFTVVQILHQFVPSSTCNLGLRGSRKCYVCWRWESIIFNAIGRCKFGWKPESRHPIPGGKRCLDQGVDNSWAIGRWPSYDPKEDVNFQKVERK